MTDDQLKVALRNIDVPGHDHFVGTLAKGKPQWWEVKVVVVDNADTYRTLQAKKSLPFLQSLLNRHDKHVIGVVPDEPVPLLLRPVTPILCAVTDHVRSSPLRRCRRTRSSSGKIGSGSMGSWVVDGKRKPGVLFIEVEGALEVADVEALVAKHNAAIDAFGDSPYTVFCDLRAMKVLAPAGGGPHSSRPRPTASSHANFKGSAVLVASQTVGMQHRRTSVSPVV